MMSRFRMDRFPFPSKRHLARQLPCFLCSPLRLVSQTGDPFLQFLPLRGNDFSDHDHLLLTGVVKMPQ